LQSVVISSLGKKKMNPHGRENEICQLLLAKAGIRHLWPAVFEAGVVRPQMFAGLTKEMINRICRSEPERVLLNAIANLARDEIVADIMPLLESAALLLQRTGALPDEPVENRSPIGTA
jgi:hypothetical protein